MTTQQWQDPTARSIALFIDGSTDPDCDADGTPLIDVDFLVFVNAWWQQLTFCVPGPFATHSWEIVCDSFDPARAGRVGPQVDVGPRSATVIRSCH